MSDLLASDLNEEVALLRNKLADAEATLRAIREGEVDALLVRGGAEDKIFHLGEGSESYRAFMEAMDLGAAAIDENGRLLFVNSGLARLLGAQPDEVVNQGFEGRFGDSASLRLSNLLAGAGSQKQSCQLTLGEGDNQLFLIATATPLPLPFGIGRAITFTDITDRLKAEAAAESERIGRAILASSHEPVIVCDRNGSITRVNPAVTDLLGSSPVGQAFSEAFQMTFGPATGLLSAADFVDVALNGGAITQAECILIQDRRARDLIVSAVPLKARNGETGGCIVTLMDVSERKAIEQRQRLLMRELDHRMKNMLTMVTSISVRTGASATSLADFRVRFGQRLAALAATQTLLATREWAGLSVEELIRAELDPYVSSDSARVTLGNCAFAVTRDASIALGLVFHELVTNAVKYGALSTDAGNVSIRAEKNSDGSVNIIWEEKDGPPVQVPKKVGFGQTIISRGLGSSAAHPTIVSFLPSGLICRLTLCKEALS
jgi:two-component sensor histidine kinase